MEQFNGNSFKEHTVSDEELKQEDNTEKKSAFNFGNIATMFKEKLSADSTAPYDGPPIINPAIFVDQTFQKIEAPVYDADAVAKIVSDLYKAEERKVFLIDVGDLHTEEAKKMLEQIIEDTKIEDAPKIPRQKNDPPVRVVKSSGQKNDR